MSKWRRWIAIAVAVYLLLVLLDRFVLVELFVRRCGVALAAAVFEALALVGIGYAVTRVLSRAARNPLRRREAGVPSPSTRLGMTRWGELDLARDLLIGYPLFGALCFLLGLLSTAAPLMLAILVVAGVWGIYAVVRRFESRPVTLDAIGWPPAIILVLIVIGVVMAQAPPA